MPVVNYLPTPSTPSPRCGSMSSASFVFNRSQVDRSQDLVFVSLWGFRSRPPHLRHWLCLYITSLQSPTAFQRRLTRMPSSVIAQRVASGGQRTSYWWDYSINTASQTTLQSILDHTIFAVLFVRAQAHVQRPSGRFWCLNLLFVSSRLSNVAKP